MINCPVCKYELEVEYGLQFCSKCKSQFDYKSNDEVVLIKRNKFDYSLLFESIIGPLAIIPILWIIIRNGHYDKILSVPLGLYLILYPLILFLKQLNRFDLDSEMLIGLYDPFFKKELKSEDIGRQIAFYIMFIFNIIGLIMVVIKVFI
jgi:hypothetical protein